MNMYTTTQTAIFNHYFTQERVKTWKALHILIQTLLLHFSNLLIYQVMKSWESYFLVTYSVILECIVFIDVSVHTQLIWQ